MLPPWNGFCTNFEQLECFPVEIAFYQHFSSWNAFPLIFFFTSFSAARMLPHWNCFYTSISAVRMFPPWNCFLPAFQQLERFPLEIVFASISLVRMLPSISAVRMLSPWSCCLHKHFSSWNAFPLKLFFTRISAVRMLPPWTCFLPAFQQLECFPVEITFYHHFSS